MVSSRNLAWLVLVLAWITGVASENNNIPIEIDLQADWYGIPFAVEVISSYYPLLRKYVDLRETVDDGLSDHQVYQTLTDYARAYLSQDQLANVDLSLGLHRQLGVAEAYNYYFTQNVSPGTELDTCQNVLVYNDKKTCDSGEIFAFETVSKRDDHELLPNDRIYGVNPGAPLAILYGDVVSESFPAFHNGLLSSAEQGKIRYLLRYKPSADLESLKPTLSGYGVGLSVKRTDYLVIDDRKTSENESESDKASPQGQFTLQSTEESSTISKADLALLGFRAANFILENKDPYHALKNISYDFPKYVSSLAELKPHQATIENLRANSQNGVAPGQNLVAINGAVLNHVQSSSIFSMLEVMDTEKKSVIQFAEKLGIDESSASKFITANAFSGAKSLDNTRYDYRTNGLVWLNDIENDPIYNEFSNDWQDVFTIQQPGMLPLLKKNIFSVVMALDFSNLNHLRLAASALGLLGNPNLPIQVGIIPLVGSEKADIIAKQFNYLKAVRGQQDALRFLVLLSNGADNDEALLNIVSRYGQKSLPKLSSYDTLVEDLTKWMHAFDITLRESLIFVDGTLIPSVPQWIQFGAQQLGRDLEVVERLVESKEIENIDMPLRDYFLKDGLKSKSSSVVPTNIANVEYVDMYNLLGDDVSDLVSVISIGDRSSYSSYWFVGDYSEDYAFKQTIELVEYISREKVATIKLNLVPISGGQATSREKEKGLEKYTAIKDILLDKHVDSEKLKQLRAMSEGIAEREEEQTIFRQKETGKTLQKLSEKICNSYPSICVGPVLVANGRIINIDPEKPLSSLDLEFLLKYEKVSRLDPIQSLISSLGLSEGSSTDDMIQLTDSIVNLYSSLYVRETSLMNIPIKRITSDTVVGNNSVIELGDRNGLIEVLAVVDPITERGQELLSYIDTLSQLPYVHTRIIVNPEYGLTELPLKRFYRAAIPIAPSFDISGAVEKPTVVFDGIPQDTLLTLGLETPSSWIVTPVVSEYDLDNIILNTVQEGSLKATYQLDYLLLEGHAFDYTTRQPPRGASLDLGTPHNPYMTDTIVMANLGYFQFKVAPGLWSLNLKNGSSSDIFTIVDIGSSSNYHLSANQVWINNLNGETIYPQLVRNKGREYDDVLAPQKETGLNRWGIGSIKKGLSALTGGHEQRSADINIFSVASGHLYERFLSIMTVSVMNHTSHTVKFWLIEDFLSPSFKEFLPTLATEYGFEYEYITYKWPHWLRSQSEKQRTIWAYKILFLDVMFPQTLDKVIFVDADQIVRADLKELVDLDLQGAPYGYTPMCDSRTEMEGFRFWKQGYWKNYLKGLPYHISALYVIDLNRFRQLAAGDRLREAYQALSADPESLSNLDQDLPNHMQFQIPIFSLPQDWLWCETWCSDEALLTAKTIDLCNNPLTKEPKLDRARRQVPEWVAYDEAVGKLRDKYQVEKKRIELQEAEVGFGEEIEEAITHEDL